MECEKIECPMCGARSGGFEWVGNIPIWDCDECGKKYKDPRYDGD